MRKLIMTMLLVVYVLGINVNGITVEDLQYPKFINLETEEHGGGGYHGFWIVGYTEDGTKFMYPIDEDGNIDEDEPSSIHLSEKSKKEFIKNMNYFGDIGITEYYKHDGILYEIDIYLELNIIDLALRIKDIENIFRERQKQQKIKLSKEKLKNQNIKLSKEKLKNLQFNKQ